MHLLRTLALVSALAGCGGGSKGTDNDPYPTFQACFDDHTTGGDMFDSTTAIKICCLDHPIGGVDMNVVCGSTSADCVTYIGMNLSPAPAASDIQAACDGYIHDRGQ
jgi:hypothetical protein